MISVDTFDRLVAAASRAPSADNMQAWAFTLAGDAVEARLEPSRVLPTDVHQMFAWIGLGAAVENLVIAAAQEGFSAGVDYPPELAQQSGPSAATNLDAAVTVRLTPGGPGNPLAAWIEPRETNRALFAKEPIVAAVLAELSHATSDLTAGVHWVSGAASLDLMARMDARSTYLRLEHQPLHDELFDILRFSRREMEEERFGLEFEGIGVPYALVRLARLLRYPSVMKLVSRLGIGRAVARQLAAKLRAAGAVCLVTARMPGPAGYVEAGRAMERLWLEATARGLAVQPHGVLPQYLTKLDDEPDGFTPRFADVMRQHREPFARLFPCQPDERPAIVLRVGRAASRPARHTVRLPLEQVIRLSEAAQQ